MWSYYGSKKSIVDCYPPPKFDKIIEPFAGAASYAVKYWDRDITLVDKYEVVARIWKWLQKCEVSDIDKLPHHLTRQDHLDNIKFECIEAKWLMGFIVAKGMQSPVKKPSKRGTTHRPNNINFQLQRIKNYLPKIKHWKIIHGDYRDLKNIEATWFVDPPYQHGGHAYPENKIDFNHLAGWCRSRKGQVIVCENTKADWMDFNPMINNKGTHKITTEAIWSNYPTAFDNVQLEIKL